MKEKMIRLVEGQVSKLCKEAYSLLRNTDSYNTQNLDKRNIDLLLLLLDSSFQKPYNRLSCLAHFINDEGQIMIDQMYPFGFLSESVKKQILSNSQQATRLGLGLDASEINPDFVVLWQEECFKNYER